MTVRHQTWLARVGRFLFAAVKVLFVSGLTGITCGPGVRQGEIECELAAAKLVDCCPVFTSELSCTYYPGGCTEDPSPPASGTRCIQRMSCEEIREHALCEGRIIGDQRRLDDARYWECP